MSQKNFCDKCGVEEKDDEFIPFEIIASYYHEVKEYCPKCAKEVKEFLEGGKDEQT